MNILIKILISLFSILLIIAASFYLYIQTLPTAPPDFIDVNEINPNKPAKQFQCSNNKQFNYAYAIKINIESMLNGQQVYHSNISFKTQLQQANDAIIQGIANDIIINEGQGALSINDVYYISRVSPQPYAMFTAFNDLGLAEKHPMKILSQLLKALSVGKEDEKYYFPYDSMQRTYHYNHNANTVTRNGSATTTNFNKLATSLQSSNDNSRWKITLGDDCMPLVLASQEYQSISAAGHKGYIKFNINAEKIPSYRDLKQLKLTNFSNINNHWQTQGISASEFEKAVANEQELWDIINSFSTDKNTAKLIKAADYLIDNIHPDELTERLLDQSLTDVAKRDLAFGLSLSGHDDAENYLIDTLTSLSNTGTKGDRDLDLQKVRLMVALSGNGQVSEQGFQALASLSENTSESDNVRNNALINLGSTLQQLENQGQGSSGLVDQLTSTISQAMETNHASSAILAAGNAKLENLDQQIMSKLSSDNSKERYAAASVLARNPDYNDNLIEHLATEPSDLVSYAILTNFDSTSLTSQQRDQLLEIASHASTDISNVINKLID